MSISTRSGHWREEMPSRDPDTDSPAEAQALREAKRRRLQLSAIAVALLLYTTLGWAISLFQSGRIPPTALTTASVALTPLGAAVRDAAPGLVYLVSAIILLMNHSRLSRRPVSTLFVPLLGIAMLWMTMAVNTQNPTTGLTFITLMAIIAVTAWSIEVRPGDLVVLGRIGVGIAAISLMMAVTTDMAWTNQEEDSKALVGDAVLAGFFPQMNPLGMSMAITLPFTLMFRHRAARISGFAAVAITLLLASSRTAAVAAGIALAAGLLVRVVPRMRRVVLGYLISFIVVAVSVIVPFRSDDADFTRRGAVWRASLGLIPDRPVWGYGPGVYGLEGTVSRLVSGAYWHGHNTVITFALVGGVVALVALLLFLLPSMRAALATAKMETVLPFMAMVTILALGIAEAPIRPSEYDGVAWVSWLCLFAISSSVLKEDQSNSEVQQESTPAKGSS